MLDISFLKLRRPLISQQHALSPTAARLRVFLKDTHVGHDASATLLRLMEWSGALQTKTLEIVANPPTSDSIEQIAENLVEPASGIERQLLLKSVQEALYYCVGFATNLTAPQITMSVKRWLAHHGQAALLQRFLSLYFFNAIWLHTAEVFRGQAITVEALERDLQQLEQVCHEAIGEAYEQIETLEAASAEQLLRAIEQRLRTIRL